MDAPDTSKNFVINHKLELRKTREQKKKVCFFKIAIV